MKWKVIDRYKEHSQPQCNLCGYSSQFMGRFEVRSDVYAYICSMCAISVYDCINKWDKSFPNDFEQPDIKPPRVHIF